MLLYDITFGPSCSARDGYISDFNITTYHILPPRCGKCMGLSVDKFIVASSQALF